MYVCSYFFIFGIYMKVDYSKIHFVWSSWSVQIIFSNLILHCAMTERIVKNVWKSALKYVWKTTLIFLYRHIFPGIIWDHCYGCEHSKPSQFESEFIMLDNKEWWNRNEKQAFKSIDFHLIHRLAVDRLT